MKCWLIKSKSDNNGIGLFFAINAIEKEWDVEIEMFESNPLEPIVEAADRLKSPATDRIRLLIAESAISKAMAIVEGGKP